MKKLGLILVTFFVTITFSVYIAVNRWAIFNETILIENDTISIKSNINFIQLNNCLNNAFIKPYLQASFINKNYIIELTKDQWTQIIGFDAFIGHDMSMAGDSVIIDTISGIGDYRISLGFVSESGATGAKDKQLGLAISINDTIRMEGIRCFPVSKDNDGLFTSIPSFAKYHLKPGDVIKGWLINTTDNSDYVLKHSSFNFDKL